MSLRYCLLSVAIVLALPAAFTAQPVTGKPDAGLIFMQGINHVVVRSEGQSSLMGYSFSAMAFGRFQRKKSAVFFEPCVWFGKNSLRAEADPALILRIPQHGIGLMPAAGISFRDHTSIRIGVLVEWMGSSYVEVISVTGMRLSRPEYMTGLFPNSSQAAITFEYRAPLGRFRRFLFHLMLQQYMTPAFDHDYRLSGIGTTMPVVFTARALPSVLVAGFSVSLFRNSKAEPENSHTDRGG